MEWEREEHWFIEVSATVRQVEPWNRRLWATSSEAARWVERFLTTTSLPGPSAMWTWEGEGGREGGKCHETLPSITNKCYKLGN